jgi:hypothetical protein
MKRFVLAALAAALFVVAAPAAFAASIDIGQAVNGIVTALIAALVGWVAIAIKNKSNIDIEAKHREAITAFVR